MIERWAALTNSADWHDCEEHESFVDGCRACLRSWLDRKPPPGSWRDFPRADATGPLDLGLKAALTNFVGPDGSFLL